MDFSRIIYSKCFLLSVGLFLAIIYLLQMRLLLNIKRPNFKRRIQIVDDIPIEYLIDTPGCKIPNFNILSPEIQPFIKSETFPLCKNGTRPLFESNRTSIYLLEASLPDYNLDLESFDKIIDCCYQYFKRREPRYNETGESHKLIVFDQCVPLSRAVHVNPNENFVKVKCDHNTKIWTKIIYEDYFHFIPKFKYLNIDNNETELENEEGSFENEDEEENILTNESKQNVLILGLDGISRLNFHRQMPQTAQYLKEELKAVELLGYNKIADASFPNLFVLLTGHPEIRFKNMCHVKWLLPLDRCNFIWKKYKALGYVTAFGEERARLGIFNHDNRQGFKHQPTDYFYNQFDYLAEYRIGGPQDQTLGCIGTRYSYNIFLDYIENFALTMTEEQNKYFAFYWLTSLSHDNLNGPRVGDSRIVNLFKRFKDEGVLNDTVIIFLSDHGIRYGAIRYTYQGSFEERLPFIFILLPEKYREEYPNSYENLQENAKRLTTPYDIYKTLEDLITFNNDLDEIFRSKPGISLFENIPAVRTCVDAHIQKHWCSCKHSVLIDVNDDDVLSAAHFTVFEHINNLLLGYPQCEQLTLFRIISARRIFALGNIVMQEKNIHDYTIIFRTIPGDAIFEATVRKYGVNGDDFVFKISGTVSRLNLYGTQSNCITDNTFLRLYCYCKNQNVTINT